MTRMPLYRHSLNIAHVSVFMFIATKTDLYVVRKGAFNPYRTNVENSVSS